MAAVRVARVLRRGQQAERRGARAPEGRARRRGELARGGRKRYAPGGTRREKGQSGALGGGLSRRPQGHPHPIRTYTACLRQIHKESRLLLILNLSK